jgi:hypothetical protein
MLTNAQGRDAAGETARLTPTPAGLEAISGARSAEGPSRVSGCGMEPSGICADTRPLFGGAWDTLAEYGAALTPDTLGSGIVKPSWWRGGL